MNKLNKEYLFAILLLVFISIFTAIDVYEDAEEGASVSHLSIEIAVIIFSLLIVSIFVRRLMLDKKRLQVDLNQTRSDLQHWKQQSSTFVQGLAQEIDAQFERWQLSRSEKDIALLLIKGLSSKEISEIRGTAEKTVRVQTSSLYKKASVANRRELSAFFLEDLLAPDPTASHQE